MANLQKAVGFNRDRNYVQSLRYSELALKKLKQLNDHPIEDIDEALRGKFTALNFMGQFVCERCGRQEQLGRRVS